MTISNPVAGQRIPFADLVKFVHQSEVADQLTATSPSGAHIRVPGISDQPFVAPDFDIDGEVLDPNTKALLISAPAAVGKSSLGAQLARETKNLVWDLSRFSVGSGFFTGTLVDTFGTSGLEAVRSSLRTGKSTLILDAADEALVRAGSRNFQAAVENLASLIADAQGPGPAIVVLGRPDTIDDTKRLLVSHGIQIQDARVAFFNEAQARAFVKAKAGRPGRRGIATAELENFLDRFFEIVGSALGTGAWEFSESFLGYAPVLDALGAFYKDEDNPMRRLNEINKSLSSAHVWDLLIEIIESILDRETEKFGRNFGGSNDRKRQFGMNAYTRKNQLTLLLSDLPDDTEIDVPLDEYIEESWIFDDLMPQVRAQYREHPFLNGENSEPNPLLRFASTAFRDYAVAGAIAANNGMEVARLLDYWADPRVTPSPMLSRFCMSEPIGITRVAADAITMISDSHSTGFQHSVRLEIEVYEGHDGDGTTSSVEATMLEGHAVVRQIKADLDGGEPLRLARSVARTSIECAQRTVVTGSGFQDFSIGPDVSIHCGQFDSESSGVRVVVEEERPNELQTTRILGSTRIVHSPRSNGLRIVVPVAVFPWQPYKSAATEDGLESESSIYWAGMELRRNIKWFAKESMVNGLSYPIGAFEAILAKGRASQDAHDFCVLRGVVVKRNEYWEMRLPGISPTTVFDNSISNSTYRAFLQDFVDWLRKQ